MVLLPSSNNYKLLLAYSGTHYFGFQRTKMGPSIEEAIERALVQILQHPISLQGASRTDRGVHAEGQVVNFFSEKDLDCNKLLGSLRALLPKDIAPLSLERVKEDFHPTLDAKGKVYHYQICNFPTQLPFHREFSWHFYEKLEGEKMRLAAKEMVGRRDFSALSNLRVEDPICFVEKIEVNEECGRLLIQVVGENFLYKMVRNIVGTLVHVGCGKLPLESLPAILESRDRRLAGVTAPAHGLSLKEVFY